MILLSSSNRSTNNKYDIIISQALGATHAEVSTHLIVTLKMNLFADEEGILERGNIITVV